MNYLGLIVVFSILLLNFVVVIEGTTRNIIVRLGTRTSPLAMAQAKEVKGLLEKKFPTVSVQIKGIMTKGDIIQNQALSEIGGKGLFVKELDVALLNKDVDICVHSMKDVPTVICDGSVLPCILPRETTNDVFISHKYKSLSDIPAGSNAVIGSASLRRKAQLLNINPNLKVVNFRGNVQSRLRKLEAGEVDGTLLALAGLKRLGNYNHLINSSSVLPFSAILPAVAQGAIGIQCRDSDKDTINMLEQLNDPISQVAVESERSFLQSLDGNCRTPIACQVRLVNDKSGQKRLLFTSLVSKPDGKDMVKVVVEAPLQADSPNNLQWKKSQINRIKAEAQRIGKGVGEYIRQILLGEEKFREYHDSFIE